jgi:hypothetical protein
MPLISKTKSTEAQLQLEHVYNLEKSYYYMHSKYLNDLLEIGFEQEKLVTDGTDGRANYQIEIVESGPTTFIARATAVVNYKGDGKNTNDRGDFGEKMPHGFVNEEDTPYRLGAAYLTYGELKLGIDSDRWIRHPIQDMWAHNMNLGLLDTRQPGFRSLSNSIAPYFQTKSVKQGIRFSLYE